MERATDRVISGQRSKSRIALNGSSGPTDSQRRLASSAGVSSAGLARSVRFVAKSNSGFMLMPASRGDRARQPSRGQNGVRCGPREQGAWGLSMK
jgi:hypothetical protein